MQTLLENSDVVKFTKLRNDTNLANSDLMSNYGSPESKKSNKQVATIVAAKKNKKVLEKDKRDLLKPESVKFYQTNPHDAAFQS
jgi:hypothetical protein